MRDGSSKPKELAGTDSNDPQMSAQQSDILRDGQRRYRGDELLLVHILNVFLHGAYFLCYQVGLRTARLGKTVFHQILAWLTGPCKEKALSLCRTVWSGCKKLGRWVFYELFGPVIVLIKAVFTAGRRVREGFRGGLFRGLISIATSLLFIVTQVFKALLHILNYAAPVAAVYLLVLTINYFANVNYALAVNYDGYSVGYVGDLSVYDSAEDMLRQRIGMITLPEDEIAIGKTTYSVAFVPKGQLSTAYDIADRMIARSTSDLVDASGVYVDGVFLGAVSDGTDLRAFLQRKLDGAVEEMLHTLAPAEDSEESDDEDAETADAGRDDVNALLEEFHLSKDDLKASFLRDIVIEDGLFPKEGIIPSTGIREQFDSLTAGEITYTVEKGDSPWTVASAHGLTVDEFLTLNPGADSSFFIGDQVVLSREVPYLQVQLMAPIEYTEEVPFAVEKVESADNYVGYAKTVSAGEKGEELVVAQVTFLGGQEVDRVVASRTTVKEPVNEQVMVGTKPRATDTSSGTATVMSTGSSTPVSSTGSMMWPVDGGYISCGWYGYPGHAAIDIGAKYGTNIRAADGGLVEIATHNNAIGYGKYIVINHGNGIKTLYAHCSALYVTAGTYVSKGEIIAAVGQTGNAYGNHLHIEVIVNGVKKNPIYYVGSSYWR